MRIVLNGVPGVGKSTVAKLLAETLNLPHCPEIFENNPYMKDGHPTQITQFQLNTSWLQYCANESGVFEVSPRVSTYIFLNQADRDKVNFRKQIYNYELYLDAPYRVIRNRILERNRRGLANVELMLLPDRLRGYYEYIDNFVNTRHIISATPSPAEIVNEIISTIIK